MVFLHDAAVSVQQVEKFTDMQIFTLMGRSGVISCQLVICFHILDGCIKKHSLILGLQFSPWPFSSDCHFRLGFSLYCKTTAVQRLILVPSLDKILCSVAVHGTWLSTMECCCATNMLEMLPLPWPPDLVCFHILYQQSSDKWQETDIQVQQLFWEQEARV
jgi:hypothetical protein